MLLVAKLHFVLGCPVSWLCLGCAREPLSTARMRRVFVVHQGVCSGACCRLALVHASAWLPLHVGAEMPKNLKHMLLFFITRCSLLLTCLHSENKEGKIMVPLWNSILS